MTHEYGGYRRRSSAFKMRLIIAAVIALIGIIGYYTRTEVNPVTGEKQRIAMSVDQEIAMGLQAAPEMAAQMGGVIDPARDPRASMVSEVGAKLVASSDAKKSPYAQNYDFHLLADSKTVNAFALPGGQIFITLALYEKLQNEAQLAGVLGHEIGHVIHRHAAEHLAKGQLGQSLAVAVGVGAGDTSGPNQAYMMAQMVSQVVQLKYGREDELESDNFGMKYMAQAGYHPAEMMEVMRILKEASGGGGSGPDFMATHPHPEDRMKQIDEIVKRDYANATDLTKGRPLHGTPALEQ